MASEQLPVLAHALLAEKSRQGGIFTFTRIAITTISGQIISMPQSNASLPLWAKADAPSLPSPTCTLSQNLL